MTWDTSDAATGLPPLADVIPDDSLFLATFDASIGVTRTPGGDIVPVRFLHVRGLVNAPDGAGPEWAQIHIAVPVSLAVDVAAALAKGTPEELG